MATPHPAGTGDRSRHQFSPDVYRQYLQDRGERAYVVTRCRLLGETPPPRTLAVLKRQAIVERHDRPAPLPFLEDLKDLNRLAELELDELDDDAQAVA